jgi:hypothetical protein
MEKPCVGRRFLTTRVRLPHQFRTRNDLAKTQHTGSSPAGPTNELVGNGTRDAQRHRAVSNRIPSEAIADLIDGTVGRPTCHAYFGAGATGFILKSKRELQLQIPVLLKMRHRDRQKRDGFLIGVFCQDRAHQFLGKLGEDHGRGDWRVKRRRASD